MTKRYACKDPNCTVTFSTSGHLSRHMKLHTGVLPFECPIVGCTSKFSRRDNMKEHYKSHERNLKNEGIAFTLKDSDALAPRRKSKDSKAVGSMSRSAEIPKIELQTVSEEACLEAVPMFNSDLPSPYTSEYSRESNIDEFNIPMSAHRASFQTEVPFLTPISSASWNRNEAIPILGFSPAEPLSAYPPVMPQSFSFGTCSSLSSANTSPMSIGGQDLNPLTAASDLDLYSKSWDATTAPPPPPNDPILVPSMAVEDLIELNSVISEDVAQQLSDAIDTPITETAQVGSMEGKGLFELEERFSPLVAVNDVEFQTFMMQTTSFGGLRVKRAMDMQKHGAHRRWKSTSNF